LRAKQKREGEIRGADVVRGGEVCDGPRDAQHAVEPAR
jgi:hypothetical protein